MICNGKRLAMAMMSTMAMACGCRGQETAPPVAVHSAEYRLVERLGHSWTDEPLRFELHFPEGAGREIVAVTANDAPVVFQTEGEERHADGSLATARIHTLADLPAGGELVFRALTDPGAAPAAAPAARPLEVHEDDGLVTLATATAGLRLPLGVFTADIPTPFLGFRLADGRWVGGGRWMGRAAPQRLEAELTARGPVFAEVRLRYQFPDDKTYELTCRLYAGENVVLFDERFGLEPGTSYHLNHTDQHQRFPQGRYGYRAEFEQSHWLRLDFGTFAAPVRWQDPTIAGGGDTRNAADPWIGTLHPWNSWHGGTLELPLADDTAGLALIARHAGQWRRVMENLLLLRRDADGSLFVQLPVNSGVRSWGVVLGPPNQHHATGEERNARQYPGLDHPSPVRLARLKYGELALERLKAWTLAWDDATPVPYPLTIHPRGDWEAARARIAAEPVLRSHGARVTANWERQRQGGNLPFTQNWVMTPDGVEDAYLATGEQRHARELVELTLARFDYYIHQTLAGLGFHNYRHGHNYGMFHLTQVLPGQARMVDLCLGSPHVTAEEKAALRARLAFFGHLFTDPDYWPANDIGKGTFNMVAARDAFVGLAGALLPGHPQAAAWQAVGARSIEHFLANNIYPSGAINEGMHYSGVTLDFYLPLLAMLRQSGGHDYFQDERLKQGLRWYAAWLPPSDKRFGRAYMPPFAYSHPANTSQSVRWAVAAAMTADSDPELSALMMRTWRQSGSVLGMVVGDASYHAAFAFGLVDPTLPAASGADLASGQWPGFGAVLRSHSDTPHETFFAIQTSAPGAFRIYPNEGAFHLYARGVPLSLRFGARSFNAIATMQAWMSNRITFDKRDECTWDTGRIVRWASLDAADLFGGEYRFTRLAAKAAMTGSEPGNLELSEPRVVDTKLPYGEGNGFHGDHRNVPPQQWRRFVLFAKDADPLAPQYFLVRDNFQGTLPTDWNLWVLANDGPALEGDRASFTGRFGVDLDAFMLEKPDHIVTGAWGPDWERQRLLQLQRGVNGSHAVLLVPRGADEPAPTFAALADGDGARLEWAVCRVAVPAAGSAPGAGARLEWEALGRVDWVFLTEDPVAYEADGVSFQGRAGILRQQPDRIQLTLLDGEIAGLAGFHVMHGRHVVGENEVREATDGPLSLSASLGPDARIAGQSRGGPREVKLTVPHTLPEMTTLLVDGEATPFTLVGHTYEFLLPPGEHNFTLQP